MTDTGSYALHIMDKNDQEVAYSPFHFEVISTTPAIIPADLTLLWIGLSALAFMVLIVGYRVRRRNINMSKKVGNLQFVEQQQSQQIQTLAEQEAEAKSQISNLCLDNQKLHASLAKTKHSEAELALMKKAMEDLSADRSDELRGVLIDV